MALTTMKTSKNSWNMVQREDLVVDGAMTDPKGDRGLRAS